ncbi:hypothetical protein ACW7BJ_20975 [Azospirillum argentinense]
MTNRTTTAVAAGELLCFVLAGVEPAPGADVRADLQAKLHRQVVTVGADVALAAVRQLQATPGPADPALRRARFAGLAAVIASQPAGRP